MKGAPRQRGSATPPLDAHHPHKKNWAPMKSGSVSGGTNACVVKYNVRDDWEDWEERKVSEGKKLERQGKGRKGQYCLFATNQSDMKF
jgi:hypothetical protein